MAINLDLFYRGVTTAQPTITDVQIVIDNITLFLLALTGVSALISVIYAGILYMISGGNATQTKKAMDALKYSLIGVAVIAGGKILLGVISSFFGGTFN